MPDFSLFWVGFCGGEREGWHIPNSKQYNQYEKCHLISFQKVCHYLKKNLYRANTLIKIHKVLTYLAMSLTDRLFFICLHFYNLILTWKWVIFACGKYKMMSIWFLCPLFILFFVNHIIRVTHLILFFCSTYRLYCIYTHVSPTHPQTHTYKLLTHSTDKPLRLPHTDKQMWHWICHSSSIQIVL